MNNSLAHRASSICNESINFKQVGLGLSSGRKRIFSLENSFVNAGQLAGTPLRANKIMLCLAQSARWFFLVSMGDRTRATADRPRRCRPQSANVASVAITRKSNEERKTALERKAIRVPSQPYFLEKAYQFMWKEPR